MNEQSKESINRMAENWKPSPPEWLYQGFLYPLHSIPERPGAHGSQVIAGPLQDGIQTLFATWFCGTGEGHIDVGIMLSEIKYEVEKVLQLPEVGEYDPFEPIPGNLFSYSTPRLVANMENRACGNAVPFIDEDGRFHLWFTAFYTKGSELPPGEDPGRRDIFYQYSARKPRPSAVSGELNYYLRLHFNSAPTNFSLIISNCHKS